MRSDLSRYDWDNWVPGMRATLVFIFDDTKVLLIEKKTGLGAGKVNAPGGKIEVGETAYDCAVRELNEEVGLQAQELTKMAELRFLMSDHADIFCTVFFGRALNDVAVETREAKPFWVDVDKIPYERMWADDRVWLPIALSGQRVLASFQFDGDTMLSEWIQELE